MYVTLFVEHHFILQLARARSDHFYLGVCLNLKYSEAKLQFEVVEYLTTSKADIHAQDQFKNTCLNDAIRHK